MNSLLLDALKFNNQSRPPVWLMRQAGRYMPSYQAIRKKHSFLQICHEPELIHQVTHLPIEEFQLDAAILFSDILMVPEALGFQVRFDDNVGPLIDNHLKHPDDINHFSLASFQLPFLPKAIVELKKTLTVPLIGFTGGPFTLASYIIEGKTSRELKTTKRWAYENPEGFEKIISLLESAIIESLKLQIASGCDVVQIFDSWANVLNQEHFEKWCLAPLKRIVAAITNTPLIYFCRGSSYRAAQIAASGVTAISADWTCPIETVRTQLPKTPLQGNLDPEALYLPKDRLILEVQKMLSKMKDDPGYIFNLGHGILPDVPYENVRALIDTVKNSR